MIFKKENYSDSTFTMLDNEVIRDNTISLAARGLLHYMLSCCKDWKFSIDGLCKATNTKLAKLNTCMKELVAAGYVKKETKRDEKGKIIGFEWNVSEIPSLLDNDLF